MRESSVFVEVKVLLALLDKNNEILDEELRWMSDGELRSLKIIARQMERFVEAELIKRDRQ